MRHVPELVKTDQVIYVGGFPSFASRSTGRTLCGLLVRGVITSPPHNCPDCLKIRDRNMLAEQIAQITPANVHAETATKPDVGAEVVDGGEVE